MLFRSEDEIQIYKFNGSALTLVASRNYNSEVKSIKWSPDGRYLAIGGYMPVSADKLQICSFNGSALTVVVIQAFGLYAYSLDWSFDGRYLAVGGYSPTTGHNTLEAYTLRYGPETQTQAISNSIVFGNSALGSDYDLNVRVLAGAQVNVDGLLNCDNLN